MATQTKVRKIGNSLGIILPKETVQALRVEEGSTLYMTEAPENSVNLTVAKPGFDEVMEIAKSLMDRYPNALRELAK